MVQRFLFCCCAVNVPLSRCLQHLCPECVAGQWPLSSRLWVTQQEGDGLLCGMQNWAATAQANMNNMSVRSAGVLSGVTSTILASTDSQSSFMAGTKQFAAKSKDIMGKGSALFSNVRGKFVSRTSTGGGGR